MIYDSYLIDNNDVNCDIKFTDRQMKIHKFSKDEYISYMKEENNVKDFFQVNISFNTEIYEKIKLPDSFLILDLFVKNLDFIDLDDLYKAFQKDVYIQTQNGIISITDLNIMITSTYYHRTKDFLFKEYFLMFDRHHYFLNFNKENFNEAYNLEKKKELNKALNKELDKKEISKKKTKI